MDRIGGLYLNGGTLRKYAGSAAELILPPEIKTVGDRAFAGTAVRRVTLPEGVTGVGMGAFERCTSLEEIALPKSLGYIGREAFRGCTALTSVDIPRNTRRLNSGCFYGCTSLSEVRLHEDIMFGSEVFEGCPSIRKLTAGDIAIVTPRLGREAERFERLVRCLRYKSMPPRAGMLPPQITAQLAAELYFRFGAADARRYIAEHTTEVFGLLLECGRDDLLRRLAEERELIGRDIEQLIERSISSKKHEITILLTALRHEALPAETVADRFEL